MTIPTGEYALFHYKSSSVDASNLQESIFKSWLSTSDYILDDRPHFAAMIGGYKKKTGIRRRNLDSG